MRLVTIAAVLLALSGCADNRSASFDDMRQLKASGLIEKGWVPEQLPADATDIRVRWNLDTNWSEGSFRSGSLVDPTAGKECDQLPNEPRRAICGGFVIRDEGSRKAFRLLH